MAEFLRAGGFPIWVVIVLSILSLGVAGRFAWRPDGGRLALVRALSVAAVFSILSAVSANFIAVMWKTTSNDEWAHDPDLHLLVMRGLGEAMTPAVLGFTFLALAWLFVAVGIRRGRDREI